MTDLDAMFDQALNTKKKTLEDIIELLNNKGYNTVDLKDFLAEEGNILALSLAGSGKTISIVLKLIVDYTLGRMSTTIEKNGVNYRGNVSVLVSTFSRTGAQDLENTLYEETSKLGLMYMNKDTRFSTLHSCYLDAIKKMGIPIKLMDSGKQFELVRQACKNFGIANGYPTNLDISAIIGAISYLNNRIDYLYDRDVESEVFERVLSNSTLERINITNKDMLMLVANEYTRLKKAENLSDFDDLQLLLYKYAVVEETKNESIRRYLASLYQYIIIDEFQDVSQIQYELLKVMAEGDTKLICVGDDDQCIYNFRGSDINIILSRFREDFSPSVYHFTTSYRCPTNILNPAKKLIQHNVKRYEKTMNSSKEGGEVLSYSFPNYISMLDMMYVEILKDLNNGKTVTVLGGTNFDFQPLVVYLDTKNIDTFKVGGTLFELTRAKYSNIYSVLSLVDSNCNLETIYKNLGVRIPPYKARALGKEFALRNITPLSYPLTAYAEIDRGLADAMEYFINIYQEAVNNNYTVAETMIGLLNAYRIAMKMEVVKERKDFDVIMNTLITILQTYDSSINNYSDFMSVIKKVNEHCRGYTQVIKADLMLTTIHDYKGLEADSIYAINMVEGSLPRTAVLQIENERIRDAELEEERRLAYILATRAKEKLTLCSIFGEEKTPSRYIKEMGIKSEAYIPNSADKNIQLKAKTPVTNVLSDSIDFSALDV